MGNTSKKLAAKCMILNKEEQKCVANTFRTASKNSEKILEDDLIVSGTVDADFIEKCWGPRIDPRLAQYLSNFLFGSGGNKQLTCDFNRFAELYVYNVRGTIDERVDTLYSCLGYAPNTELPYQLIREYCESIASTYIKILKCIPSNRVEKWTEKGFKSRASHVQALGEALADIGESDTPQTGYGGADITKWLSMNTLLYEMIQNVFINLYGFNDCSSEDSASLPRPSKLMPRPEGIDAMPDYPAFTDLAHIVWLNSHLPQKMQHKWRFLFSSHIHGESFSTLAGRIQDQGSSLLIIEDTNGYIFGGFASQAWVLGPNFHGDDQSFLFTVAPRMRIYPGTTFNNHYQYMNYQTKTMPNGLMMGGQFNFGGIWIEANPFGEGYSAESCTTYRGYKRLSKEQTFKIRSMEVWGVGDKPLTIKESDERDVSVLDSNPEAKAILELAGRTRHSDGIREPPPL